MSPFLIKVLLAAGVGTALAYAAGSKEANAKSKPTPLPGLTDIADADKLAKAQDILAKASQAGTPEAYSAAAYQLDQMGLKNAAESARAIAKQLSQAKGAPPVSDQPHTTIEPNMSPDLSAEVARVLRDSQDPKVLDDLAAKMRQLGYGAVADQLAAKAKQVRDTISTAATMQQIDQVMKSPGLAQNLPGTTVPVTITAKTPQEIAAHAVTSKVFTSINAAGGDVKAAKKAAGATPLAYSETMSFQSRMGLKADGKLGPGTLLKVAQFESVLPPVLYWPTSATAKTVARYRGDLETLALNADEAGKTQRAAELRASAAAEHGQGGIVGPMLA